MTQTQKKGNFSVERGGLYGARTLSDEEWLDREVKSLAVAMHADAGHGKYASRGIANIAHGTHWPHRIPARRIREAKAARVKHELARQLGLLLVEYADRKYGVRLADQRPDPDPSPVPMRKAA